jgi:hypothetical protein
MAIAKAYPELVKSIKLAKDRYSPIVLNGVISKDDNDSVRYSTNLPAVVEFHLDYKTSTNQPISIKFATGEDVSVNCLLGMSFIKAAKLIIDSNDNLVESKLMECEPFPIEYKHPSRSSPNLVPRNQPSAEKNLTVINAIETQPMSNLTYLSRRPSSDQPRRHSISTTSSSKPNLVCNLTNTAHHRAAIYIYLVKRIKRHCVSFILSLIIVHQV